MKGDTINPTMGMVCECLRCPHMSYSECFIARCSCCLQWQHHRNRF